MAFPVPMENEPGETYDLGPCSCCGEPSRLLLGRVLRDGARFAEYEVHTTSGKKHAAHVGFFVVFAGARRRAVALEVVATVGEPLAVRPLDAAGTPIARDPDVDETLTAAEALTSPLGLLAVDIAVLVYGSDPRFATLMGPPGSRARASDLAALAGLEKLDALRFEAGASDLRGAAESVSGRLVDEGGTRAEYAVTWTPGELEVSGAEVCVILGSWSPGATTDDRYAVALHATYRADAISVQVVDATKAALGSAGLAGRALAAVAVLGTPIADAAGAVVSFALAKDPRLTELRG